MKHDRYRYVNFVRVVNIYLLQNKFDWIFDILYWFGSRQSANWTRF